MNGGSKTEESLERRVRRVSVSCGLIHPRVLDPPERRPTNLCPRTLCIKDPSVLLVTPHGGGCVLTGGLDDFSSLSTTVLYLRSLKRECIPEQEIFPENEEDRVTS